MKGSSSGGIGGILDQILTSPEPRATSQRGASALAPAAPEQHLTPAGSDVAQLTCAARRGRPPGKPNPSELPKVKVTLWISAELAAFYRDWSWETRCHLSPLVERAMQDYRARHAAALVHPRAGLMVPASMPKPLQHESLGADSLQLTAADNGT